MRANPPPRTLPVTHYRVRVSVMMDSRYVCCPHGIGRMKPAETKIVLSPEVGDAELFGEEHICMWVPLLAQRYGVANMGLEPVLL